MIVFERRVGRLIEVKLVAPFLRDDLVASEATARALRTTRGAPPVLCLDLRDAGIHSPDAIEAARRLVTRNVGPLEREAIVAPPSLWTGTYPPRGAENDVPRIFDDETRAIDWLTPVLTPIECARLLTFLYDTDVQGYPFTPPAVSPPTRLRCTA